MSSPTVSPRLLTSLAKLNPQQKEAVKHIEGPLLVLAGAGSGKTGVIINKIAYLIEKEIYKANQIVAVTFTNKSAKEMNERVRKLLEGQASRGLKISTFHTLGLNLLRKEHQLAGLKPNFSILDTQDSLAVIRESIRQTKVGQLVVEDQLIWKISQWKSDLITAFDAIKNAKEEQEVAAALVYANYNEALKAYNSVDFDDLIRLPVELLQSCPQTLAKWQHKTGYLLIDEYQDTNLSQYQLIRLLTGVAGNFTAVGDDDQSIYTWRGARPENLFVLQKDYPSLKLVMLEQNYRSQRRILQTANHLIANNTHLFEKRLWSDFGIGDPIRIIACSDEQQEAERVISELIQHQFRHRCDYGDYAILYRGNHQAKVFEKILREHKIAYRISGGNSFFDRAEIRDIMSYLRLLTNPQDDQAFLRIVNKPRREIGTSTIQKLNEFASPRAISLLAACQEQELEGALSKRAIEKLQEFARWVEQLSQRATQEEVLPLIQQMLADIEYLDWLQSIADSPEDAENRWKNVQDLLDWLRKLTQSEEDKDERSLNEVTSHLRLLDILGRRESDSQEGQVNLMTLHASKGLEFPHVFMVGLEEEILPHRNSIEQDTIEEERRLAYVGITRAKTTLTITYAQKRKRAGGFVQTECSRFLAELPADDLQWENKLTADPEKSKQTGKAHLAHLRKMLGEG